MNSGRFRGRSFGPHGAHCNNSRSGGRADGGGRGGGSRGDNNGKKSNYSRENFHNNSSSQRSERSQNENWPSSRPFSRWDQPSNNQQSSPVSWAHNRGGYLRNHPMRFHHRNDSQQHYNRGNRGYFSRGDYRFSSPRGPQNIFSPYYSAPFREHTYDDHEKEVPPEEPSAPLLGSEEERQQKITEAADELKRKLLSNSVTNDYIDIDCWGDGDDTFSKSPNYNDKLNITKPILQLKSGSPELDLTPNDITDIDGLNEKNTSDSVTLVDYIPVNNSSELPTVARTCNNIQDNENVNPNLIAITTINIDITGKSDSIKDEQVAETDCKVNISNNSVNCGVPNITESFDALATECIDLVSTSTATLNSSITTGEPVYTMFTDPTSNIVSTVTNTSNNINITNIHVPDVTIMDSSIIDSLNVINDNQMAIDMNMPSENNPQKIPFFTNPTVQKIPEKGELNLIEYLQKQVALSNNKSSLSLSKETNKNITTEVTAMNNKNGKNDELFSKSSNHSPDNNPECNNKITTIDSNYCENDILQPPPLPPTLPQPSYESEELCLNSIKPQFDSLTRPSNITSPCGTFQQSPVFNSHLTATSPVISTPSAINPPINISAPMAGYAVGHQNYIPMTPFGPGVSLTYPPVIPPLDYVPTQTIPPPPPPLPHSPSIHSFILQDVCASNTNEDDDVLDELKEAMEFAKQCMVMGNEDNEAEEEDIEFPTFPDLPPVMPKTVSSEKPKGTKKNTKMKKMRQGMFGPHLKAIAEAKEKSMYHEIDTKTHTIHIPDETTTDDPNRRKVVFNLSSKFKVLNKKDDVWRDESVDEEHTLRQKKLKHLASVPLTEKKLETHVKSKRENRTEKTKESEKDKKSERKEAPEKSKGSEKSRGSGKTRETAKTKDSDKLSRHDDKNEKVNYRRKADSSCVSDKEKRDVQKKTDKLSQTWSNSNMMAMMKKSQRANPTITRKLDKITNDEIVITSEINNGPKVQLLSSNKAKPKMTIPKLLKDSSWKDRVIGRFLKMSKNDIQNMINNSSLRKFDIAMQRLVKEKKSSLSLEMRNHEDEKMKISTYDSEDFMSQLQAILDPAATVDITNLPTNFIHQLSEVLHLDASPVVNVSSSMTSEKNIESTVPSTQGPSSSTNIDPKNISESLQYIGINTPTISTHDMSKSRKIDSRVSKATVKSTPSTAVEVTTCVRSKAKRGPVGNKNIQRKTNEVTPLLAPTSSPSSLGNDNQIHANDNIIGTCMVQANTMKTSANVNKIKEVVTAPPVMNKTSKVSIERMPATVIPTTMMTKTTTTTTTTITTMAPTIARIETPIVTRVARQAVELDKLFIAGISRAKAVSSSMKTTAVDSTIDETLHDTRVHNAMHCGMRRSEISENMYRRNGIDDADVFRNMTKEEYEAYCGELPHSSYEEEYKNIAATRSRKIAGNTDREMFFNPMHADKSILYGSHSPSRAPPQNLLNQTESDVNETDSQYDSDTSSTNSSGSSSGEPSLIDVSKVLKFIKEREKMAKKKTINEEIRDEVKAEIEKHRREKNIRHKSHKSRSKKRDKRKKEKKMKKKKPKKKRRHKTHHTPHSSDSTVEQNELPLRLLADDEIKREPINEEPPKANQEVSRTVAQVRQLIPPVKTSTGTVTQALVNKSVGTELPMTASRVPLTNVTAPFVPVITSTPTSNISTFKTNPILNSPSLIVTVINTDATNVPLSKVVKAGSTPTITAPLRTVTAVSVSCNTTPQSAILQPKTKAQLKQMPEVMKTIQIRNSILESKTEELKIIEPVTSTSENQTINCEQAISTLLPNTSSTTTTAITTTQSGSKKMDIKTYHERALQRKLKEQQRMQNFVENPTQLTKDLLILPTKNKSLARDGTSSCADTQPEISVTDTATSTINHPNSGIMTSSFNSACTHPTKKPKLLQIKVADSISAEENMNKLTWADPPINIVSPVHEKLDETSAPSLVANNLVTVDAKTVENKFVNIKSEGGKELKLKEKLKKRPQKFATPTATSVSVNSDAETIKKGRPMARDYQKNSSASLKTNENVDDVIKTIDIIEVATDNSLSSVNIPTNDVKDNYRDNDPSENIETDALNTVKTALEKNEPLIQANNVVMPDATLSKDIDSIKNSEKTNCEQTLNNPSESFEKKSNISENQDGISMFSHYFKLTKGLISDGLPDTVAQERMVLIVNTQVPIITQDEQIIDVNNTRTISNEPKLQDTNEITTIEKISGVNMTSFQPTVTNNIATCDNEMEENFQNTDDLLEVMVTPDVVSDLLKDTFDKSESPLSTPINNHQNIHSPLSDSMMRPEFNLGEGATVICKHSSTELCNSAQLSSGDTTISTTFHLSLVECNKSQSYDQLTLDDLSDISMDGSILSNHKRLSQTSIADTDMLSDTQNNVEIEDLMEKDTSLIVDEQENDKLTIDEGEFDNSNECNDNTESNLITLDINKDQLPSENKDSLPDNVLSPTDCYKNYCQQQIVIEDRAVSLDQPCNSVLNDPITFSHTESPTPELIEFGELSNDNVMVESLYDNQQLDEASPVNNIVDVIAANDTFVAVEEVPNSFAQALLDNSCILVPPSMTTLSNDNIVHNSSISDKEFIQVVRMSPQPLLSPILQVPSELTENDENNSADNSILMDANSADDKALKVIEEKNDNCPLDEKATTSDGEATTENFLTKNKIAECSETAATIVDDFSKDKLSNNPIEPIIESSTLTTLTLERNSSSRDNSDRGSSEARSVEQDKTHRKMIFNSSIQEETPCHTKRDNNDSSRKSRSSKSSTPTFDHKKHKRHYNSPKKHNLTLERVEEAIATDIVNVVPKPTTKDAVMSRMQEIDIAIQRLMNEKMTLYEMLQTDKWPVNQNKEMWNEPIKSKTKLHFPPGKTDKPLMANEPRVIMSRLHEAVDVKRSTMTETSAIKSQISNTPKSEIPKTSKAVIKIDDKRSKKLNENSSKISKKRKYHHDEKETQKNKEKKRDISPVEKKRLSSGELLRQKNKSPSRVKNTVKEQRKPTKLSQMLAREFKPKSQIEKYRSATPPDEDDNLTPKLHSESEQKVEYSTTAKIIVADDVDSGDLATRNVLSHDDHHNSIYSDESSLDASNNSSDKRDRTTGLSLLERSIKREMAAKKVKSTEIKKKCLSKSSQDVSSSTDQDLDSNPSFRITLKKNQQRKKHTHIAVKKTPTNSTKHVLEIIDAVAENRINDLYMNSETLRKEQLKPKKNEKHPEVNRNNSEIESEFKANEEAPMENTKYQGESVKEDADIKSTAPTATVTPTISPRLILQSTNEYNADENDHDENEWTTLDSVGYVDDNNQSKLGQSDDESEQNEIETNKVDQALLNVPNNEDNSLQSTSSIVEQQHDIQNNNANIEIMPSKNNDIESKIGYEELREMQKSILEDWQDSSNPSDHELNYSHKHSENIESTVTEKTDIHFDTEQKSDGLNTSEESAIVIATMTSTSNEFMTSDSIEDLVKEHLPIKECNEKSKRSKSIGKELERPKSAVQELEKSKATVKEVDRPKSTVKELERCKSAVRELEKSKLTVRELNRPKSAVKELERSKSNTKEFERSKSPVKNYEISKSMVKELEDNESSNDNDDDIGDDEFTSEKRGRPAKRKRQPSSRRSSRQSDDSHKTTSRSRSHSKRTTKSPSSRDASTPDVELKKRPTSGSSSSSINSRRRSNTTLNVDIKTNDKNNTVRKGRKRKSLIERTPEQMRNCKVRLVDCKNLYMRSDIRSDILQRLGISRINSWTPAVRRETAPEQPSTKLSSIIIDEDKTRSDDESMEMIQVDDSMDIQCITSPESNADIMMMMTMTDPLSITPRASPQCKSPHRDVTTAIMDVENENYNDLLNVDSAQSSDCIEVLETRTLTPVTNPSSSEKNDYTDLETMQYTVHKGPILDIKVFGDSFLAASEDGSIYRYCQRSNGILNIYKGHNAAVTCLYIHEVPGTADSGNTRWNLFSGSLDATLRCYDIINGSLDRHIADVGSPIQCMDQAWGMIFVGTKSGHISRYDIKSGCLREDNLDFSDKPVLALRASTEGVRRVLIVASRNQPITIRDAQNGLYLRTISGQRTHTIYSLMRDRNLVYCGTSSTSIPVFDFISGDQVIQYTAGMGIVCMRLYRQLLFAGCYDGNIYIFDTKDSKLICSIPGPGNMLLSMEIVDDKIIAGSKDRRLHAWRMPSQARAILAERA